MLTYSFSVNKPITLAPLKKIASAEIVNILWHANPSLLRESMSSFADWKNAHEIVNLLNIHREETISASQKFTEEKNLPRIFNAFFKESICLLYQAYIEMLQWRACYDTSCKIELLDKNKLYAPNYFTVNGEFNDFAWSKRVVLDPNYPLDSRFHLACFYWFENESEILWSQLKKSDLVPYNSSLLSVLEEMNFLITLRIFQLENELEMLAQNLEYADRFYMMGFEEAVESGSEYATYYFWQNLAEQEKMEITGSNSFLNFFNESLHSFPLDKICYFLYSQLSKEERKKLILSKTIQYDDTLRLVILLLSPYTKEVRSELIEFVYQLPLNLYLRILEDVAHHLMKYFLIRFPLLTEEFEALWENLTSQKKDEVLKNPNSLVKILMEAKSFYKLNV